MTSYTIDAAYDAATQAEVEFPDGITWDDVAQHYIKWDRLYVAFKAAPDVWKEFPLEFDSANIIDWKRPSGYTVFRNGEDGIPVYEEPVAHD